MARYIANPEYANKTVKIYDLAGATLAATITLPATSNYSYPNDMLIYNDP